MDKIKHTIKAILWMISIMCMAMIITIKDPREFGIIAFVGFISTYVLIRWEKLEEYLDE
jgi:hypothetical protein|tara:strand:- start:4436 stop:4612 length:177 start_codon:yes stop_codon:yes gene_type:complete